MEAIFNAQVGMAFGGIAVLLVLYLVLMGWLKRSGQNKPDQEGNPAQAEGLSPQTQKVLASGAQDVQAPEEKKRKQINLQGKDAEIAAGVLRRMLQDPDALKD
jgi:hypothetical protein